MSINQIRESFKDYAKDIKINLGKIFDEDGVAGLSQFQTYGIALASAYATKNGALIDAMYHQTHVVLGENGVNAAKAAASIMAMNNIYYRFVHLVNDAEISKMPANLRMSVIANSGIEKVDFELMSLAVSAINGCGMCMESHVHEVVKGEISKQGVQSAIRIAAIVNSAAQALSIEEQ